MANPIVNSLVAAEGSSITTGKRPRWFFPVDSATNCSIQSDNPGSLELRSHKLTNCLVSVKSIEAIRIAGESAVINVLDNVSASSSKTDVSIPMRAAGTKPKADNALYLPPTFGSAFTTRKPCCLEDMSSGVPGSVIMTK